MQRIFCLGIIMLCFLQVFADHTIFILEKNSGVSESFIVDKFPKITFEGGNMIVCIEKRVVTYPLNTLKSYRFENISGLESITVDKDKKAPFRFDGEAIYFPAMEQDCKVHIFRIDGVLMTSCRIDSSTQQEINCRNWMPGIYIVSLNGEVFKIAKQ